MDHIWAISFNVIEKQGETSTQRSTKRLREGNKFKYQISIQTF